MKLVFNDIALGFKKENKYEAIKIFEKFVYTILELEKNRVSSNLVINKSLKGWRICEDYCIEQIYNEVELNKDIKRVILRVISKMKIIDIDTKNIFELYNIRSKLCAWTLEKKYIVISLDMDNRISNEFLKGNLVVGNNILKVSIPNLCDKHHIYFHQDLLDIRIYEENPKHKIGYGWGSPMDLNPSEAQKVLDEAVAYEDSKNCLVNKYNGKYYIFRRHLTNCYHGYLDNAIPDKVKSKFPK